MSGIPSKVIPETLEAELEARTQETLLLNELISTVGSTLKLAEVLQHLVKILIRAINCHAAFIYLYDKDSERLTLAGTNEQYRHLVGRLTLALGEGINGWVGLTRQPVILQNNALDDPRFLYVPELDEEHFQSIMTVPIGGKDGSLVGTINMHVEAPYEFTEQHQVFVSNVASLAAGAIENAQLYESTQRKLSILTSLATLSQTISSAQYLDDMLRSLATLTLQIMEADLCAILLMDQSKNGLRVRATAPTLNERALTFQSLEIDHSLLKNLEVRGDLPDNGLPDLERQLLNPLKDVSYKALLSQPLVAGTEHLGMLNCYSHRPRRYSTEDRTLLATIANQAAIAIKNSQLVDLLTQKNLVKSFCDNLMDGNYDSEESLRQRASFLGYDLHKPHVVIMSEMAPVSGLSNGDEQLDEAARLEIQKRLTGYLRRRIVESYPGSLLYEQENMLTCLLCLSKDPTAGRLRHWLRDLARQVHQEHQVRLTVGIGNACQTLHDYRRGFTEAREALEMGRRLEREGGITHFNDLGVYRYLYKIARMDDLRDIYQDQVERITQYDKRKGTDLLDTLETYLECAGNLTRTATRLFVHRNTLIQRLERLQSLCDLELQDRANWLTLQVAIKVYKLRSTL